MNAHGVPEISPADFSKVAGAPVSVIVPHDAQSFGTAQGSGNTIFEVAPKAKAADAIRSLVQQLGWQAQDKQPEKAATKSALLKWITQVRKK